MKNCIEIVIIQTNSTLMAGHLKGKKKKKIDKNIYLIKSESDWSNHSLTIFTAQ